MEDIRLKIKRIAHEDKQTRGEGIVLDSSGSEIFEFKTVELPWKNNEKMVSCIPTGKYTVVKRYSEKYGNHFHILDVHNRSYILLHSGNFYTQILGCVLVGEDFVDINVDGYLDVTNSKRTLSSLNDLLPQEFIIEIS